MITIVKLLSVGVALSGAPGAGDGSGGAPRLRFDPIPAETVRPRDRSSQLAALAHPGPAPRFGCGAALSVATQPPSGLDEPARTRRLMPDLGRPNSSTRGSKALARPLQNGKIGRAAAG